MENCPSHKMFIDYVNGTATSTDIIRFEKHLENCELCSEVLPVYKQSALFQQPLNANANFEPKQKTKQLHLRYALSIAASIAILLGLFVVFNQHIPNQHLANIPSYTKKTLMHKSDVSYWYIGDNKQLALNDNILNIDELSDAINYNMQQKQIYLQVESINTNEVEQIITQLTFQHSIPIYTFSKNKSISLK